jgi:formate dehydrogenase subunit gamma
MKPLTEILARYEGTDGPLLPILHDVQSEFGHVSEEAVRDIAEALNLTRAEVHGVVSFYHDFKTVPYPRFVIKLCQAEACISRGVADLIADIEGDGDKFVKIEPVYCLGLCSVGPAAMIGGKVFARLNAQRINEMIGALR